MIPDPQKSAKCHQEQAIPRLYDIVKTPQDLSYLSWDETSQPSGLGGARQKAREGTGHNAVFYKLPYKGPEEAQLKEALAALMCSRLMGVIGVCHCPIQLVRAQVDQAGRVCWVMKSKSYRGQGERSISLEQFWELRCLPGETPLEMCMRMGWGNRISELALVDYLTATRDRDASCFEVLCDASGAYRLAPFMPRSFSLVNAFPGETWKLFATANINTSNYLGAASLEGNLDLVTSDIRLPRLSSKIRQRVTGGLQGLGADDFVDASWSIVEQRWRHFESLRDI